MSQGTRTNEHDVCAFVRAATSGTHNIMARQKRNSPSIDEGNTRAVSLKTIDPAMDFGNGVSLAALTAATATTKTKLDAYNGLLSQADDALNAVESAEKAVSDLSSRLLSGVKTKFGADSSQYEQAGGTRQSEIKRAAKTPKPAKPQS